MLIELRDEENDPILEEDGTPVEAIFVEDVLFAALKKEASEKNLPLEVFFKELLVLW